MSVGIEVIVFERYSDWQYTHDWKIVIGMNLIAIISHSQTA